MMDVDEGIMVDRPEPYYSATCAGLGDVRLAFAMQNVSGL
jgi:hypothetical protein